MSQTITLRVLTELEVLYLRCHFRVSAYLKPPSLHTEALCPIVGPTNSSSFTNPQFKYVASEAGN